MKVISILNIKGGVGKTVSTINLAACLVIKGMKVLVIDLDPQNNATQYLNLYDPNLKSAYDVLLGDYDHSVIRNSNGIDMVPANIKMVTLNNQIMNDTKRSRENRLKKFIDSLNESYDFVLIDCPPSLDILSTNALVASTHVLVPIKPCRFAIDGLEYLIETVFEIQNEFNSKLQLLGVFVTMDNSTKTNKEIKEELKEALGSKFLETAVRNNVAVIKSTSKQIPVVNMSKGSNSSKDYISLCEEVLASVK